MKNPTKWLLPFLFQFILQMEALVSDIKNHWLAIMFDDIHSTMVSYLLKYALMVSKTMHYRKFMVDLSIFMIFFLLLFTK